MAPLILHNVPDEELYVGADGIQRPYAMVFSQQEGGMPPTRNRRAVAETGSFGKSNRRSRSRTGTPRRERDNPTQAVADKIFGDWVSMQAAAPNNANSNSAAGGGSGSAAGGPSSNSAQRRPSSLAKSVSHSALLDLDDVTMGGTSPATHHHLRHHQNQTQNHREPVELMLRGYRNSTQQYAAIAHFEQLAGRICEDYPRMAPMEQRRYRSELTDPAFTQRRALTSDERAKVNMAAGGEHWVKVTFESAEAAEAARMASPQNIMGYLVSAEPWTGVAPPKDEAVPDLSNLFDPPARNKSIPGLQSTANPFLKRATSNSAFPRSATTTMGDGADEASPSYSHTSSNTFDSGTNTLDGGEQALASGSAASQISQFAMRRHSMGIPTSSFAPTVFDDDDVAMTGATDVHGNSSGNDAAGTGTNGAYCRRIPTARRVQILPAEQALLPQQSMAQRVVAAVPFLNWFSGSMVGSAVPRSELGEFDWARASLYWKVVWFLDAWFGLFGGEIFRGSREE
ncbi:Nucleoporin NUP53 [Ceratocystis lukuohia]|uniref:Nucleoporin NUP53 n=1 Tax=Ceratocystis lukuohia TaxID=2019550 RepID=A0ABR4MCP8_9PEZI